VRYSGSQVAYKTADILPCCCLTYALATLYPSERFIHVRDLVNPKVILRLEGLAKLKRLVTSSRIERATFWLVALYLMQLHYRMHLTYYIK
jgi:hypothetical protein